MSTHSSPHGIVVTTSIELIGVALIAIIADTSPGAGKLMVALMIGFLIIFLLLNVSYFSSLVGKA